MPLRIASLHLTYHHCNHYQQRYFSGQSLDSIWTDFMTCGFKFHIILSSQEAVQSLSHVWLFVTPWTSAHQASLSITNSQSLLKLKSIEPVMPSNRLILCHPSPPAFYLSQHQGIFQWVSSSHQVAKVLEKKQREQLILRWTNKGKTFSYVSIHSTDPLCQELFSVLETPLWTGLLYIPLRKIENKYKYIITLHR